MKPEAQRIVIAEACGWRVEHRYKGSRQYCEIIAFSKDGKEFGVFPGDLRTEHGRALMQAAGLPDYLADLNAMHEAEKVLNTVGVSNYAANLLEAIGGLNDNSDTPNFEYFRIAHAAAAQRAEAFLKTLNLWQP